MNPCLKSHGGNFGWNVARNTCSVDCDEETLFNSKVDYSPSAVIWKCILGLKEDVLYLKSLISISGLLHSVLMSYSADPPVHVLCVFLIYAVFLISRATPSITAFFCSPVYVFICAT